MTKLSFPRRVDLRIVAIGLISFLTLVDLFAAQALLPALVRHFRVTPGAMGIAVNASTFGMAVAGIAVALFARRIDKVRGVWISLLLLAVPTALLASAPDLASFTALRIAQGLCMSTAFTLTMAHLAEHSSVGQATTALAAYITGNVASNLFGRLISAGLADHLGLAANFYGFALLNLAGAALVYVALERTPPMRGDMGPRLGGWQSWTLHLRDPGLRRAFGIGFLILFAFIGTFTYVNFVLAAPPLALGQMQLGFVYLVFLPSLVTTPLAGRIARRHGTQATLQGGFAVACLGLPLLLLPSLTAVLAGLVLVAAGTFLAQAAATGFVGSTARTDRAAASGIYLAAYYLGGLAGAAGLGAVFGRAGWPATVAAIGLSLVAAAALAARIGTPVPMGAPVAAR
jgi:YNFM family putative membrane transporter